MVHLPADGLLFTGDVMMPYLSVPFTAEGTPEGLLDTLRAIRQLAPRRLIQGHTTLTENFTIETLTGPEPALTELHDLALARIGENTPLPNILDLCYLPALLRDHPAAVVRTWSAGMTSSPGSITSAPDTGSQTDRDLTRAARKKERQLSTCSREKQPTHSPTLQPRWPTGATWPSPWK
jgi:hypothetical protein